MEIEYLNKNPKSLYHIHSSWTVYLSWVITTDDIVIVVIVLSLSQLQFSIVEWTIVT